MINDCICAISTFLSESAISIVRMSGDGCFEILKKISDLKEIEPNTIKYAHIYDGKDLVDEVLISIFKAPKSYTREDMVEINCHGGVFVTRKILNLLLTSGARLAERGEFTRRAYLNGRIDLSKAESINDLINASTSIASLSAIKGVNGSVSKLLTPLMDEIKDLISKIEVNIDYPEYDDVETITKDHVIPSLNKWIKESNEMINKAERFVFVKDGIKTAIIGKPNVGKSSLLNSLLNEDKAIVTDIAGTTRDIVEGKVNLDSITLNLIDTAGLRESKDTVEKIGIEKTKKVYKDADLIIHVIDASNIDDEDRKIADEIKDFNHITVYNKTDLNNKVDGIKVSCINGNIKELLDYLNNKYEPDTRLVEESVLNNERQISLMKKARDEFKDMLDNIDNIKLDVIEVNLEEAYKYLCDILGLEYKEDLIDHMFKNFCLGK